MAGETSVPRHHRLSVTSRGFWLYSDGLLGIDQESDLALLKIDEKGLPTLKFMNSDRLRHGDLVLAIGAPMGLRNSVSFGVVSSPDHLVGDNRMVYIQTDASINPGTVAAL